MVVVGKSTLNRKIVFSKDKLVPVWNEDELKFLRDNYGNTTCKSISIVLKRSPSAIKHKASRLKIPKNNFFLYVMPKLEPEFIGYLAGLIDGEGTVTITKNKGRMLPRIDINNTFKDALVYLKDRVPLFCLSNGKNLTKNHKQCYVLRAWGASRVYPILDCVLSLLIIKEKQAQIVMKFCESRLTREKENGVYTKEELEFVEIIRYLNRRTKT